MAARLLWILALLASAVEVCQGDNSTACYGTNPLCDYYSLQCPASQIIKLNNLYAGVKTQQFCGTNSSTDHCDYSAECCSYVAGDNVELFNLENTYNVYTNCSGRQSCLNVQAPWQLMTSLLPNAVTSTYVKLEYGCELASSKVPLCGGTTGSVAGIYSTVEIMFDGSTENFDPLKASKECRCTVQNIGAQQNIVFKTIDVRLPSYHRDVNQSVTACSSATFIVPNILTAKCAESTKHYQYNFYYNKQETLTLAEGLTSEISLMDIHQNGTYDSPAMVWISLTAETGRNFQVTCKEVIPAQFTTTTTTTTTTTSTSTTTTTTPTTTTTIATTTPKPPTTTTTSTTPKPTTTTTTPKPPTTTTTSTIPKPTTTTTTPKPPTTTLTTTTPKPTTTTTTTTTSTTTTPKPPTSTTTTTTPKPITTTTATTVPKLTTTTITTTTTTTTSKPTTAFTSTPAPVPTTFTTTTKATVPSKISGDGENDEEQRTAVFLAIAIPIIFGVLVIVGILLWVFWKRTLPRRKHGKFHFVRDSPSFRSDKILDQILDREGVTLPPDKSPINSFISVPAHSYKSPESNLGRSRSFMSNGSVNMPRSPIEPYVIPVTLDDSPRSVSSPTSPTSVYHVRLEREGHQNVPVTDTRQADPGKPELLQNTHKVDSTDKADVKSKPKFSGIDDGSVLIHVDNLSRPLTPRTSSVADTSSTRSQIASTPGDLTP